MRPRSDSPTGSKIPASRRQALTLPGDIGAANVRSMVEQAREAARQARVLLAPSLRLTEEGGATLDTTLARTWIDCHGEDSLLVIAQRALDAIQFNDPEFFEENFQLRGKSSLTLTSTKRARKGANVDRTIGATLVADLLGNDLYMPDDLHRVLSTKMEREREWLEEHDRWKVVASGLDKQMDPAGAVRELEKWMVGKSGLAMQESEENEYKALVHGTRAWKLLNDRKFRIQEYKIRNKDAEIVRLEFNGPQEEYWDLIEEIDANGRKVYKIVIVKARQWGGSTLTEAMLFDDMMMKENVRAGILSYQNESSDHLFRMFRTFYKFFPLELELLGYKPRLPKGEGSRSGFEFTDTLSSVGLFTARNGDAGASMTFSAVHVSEAARFRNAEQTMVSFLSALAEVPGSMNVLESTAGGIGDYFHSKWEEACRYEGREGSYYPLFIGWNKMDDARIEFCGDDDKFRFLRDMKKEDTDLMMQYNLSAEQMNWRAQTLRFKCSGSLDLFHQQFPITAKEAFLSSGVNRFSVAMIEKMQGDNAEAGITPNEYDIDIKTKKIERRKWGLLKVWEEPEEYGDYVIGVDTAEGIVVNTTKRERDDNAVYVAKRGLGDDKHKIVARFVCKWEPGDVAKAVKLMAEWYNEAFVVPERNNPGIGFVYELVTNLEYYNVYRERRVDTVTNREQIIYGYRTMGGSNGGTRSLLIDSFALDFQDERLEIPCDLLLSQMITFVRGKTGKIEAEEGCHDDTVFAGALAFWGIRTNPPSEKAVQRKVISQSEEWYNTVMENHRKNLRQVNKSLRRSSARY